MIEPKDVQRGERYTDGTNIVEIIDFGSDRFVFMWVKVPTDQFLEGWVSYVPFLDDTWQKMEK